MPVNKGTRLGPYEIVGLLGAGGMSEVYLAKDTKLGREIAIKTLSSALAEDAAWLARFEREAKLLATLNHPHIATVHGLDRHEGTTYLAMELVEGRTIEERLIGGALPVEEALRIALQIAEALEAAHGKGVVHRDLKPANVMLTSEEQVKVLDFGLAKAFSVVTGEANPAHSPTLSAAMTEKGFVLGTAAYMAPEQASGQATDQRADVWAFGVVLFEMLTGSRLFSGESVPHILAEVLKSEPDWQRLPADLNPRLRLLLARCLAKRPRARWHSMADVRIEIEAILADPRGTTLERGAGAPRAARVWLIAAGTAAVAVVAALGGWLARPAAPEPKPVVRFSVPVDSPWLDSPAALVAVSADGTRIAYVRDDQIYLHELGANEALPVPGTANTNPGGTAAPAFSPDGQWLAYMSTQSVSEYALVRVPIGGGAGVPLLVASSIAEFPSGLSWPTPDALLFADHRGIVRLPVDGGAAEVLVPLQGETEHFDSPQLLPGGDAVLFTRLNGRAGPIQADLASARVEVQSIGRNDRRVVLERSSAARYLPTGHLVYAQGATLLAVPFDAQRRVPTGAAVSLRQGLRRANRFSDTANFAVSDTGTLVMIPAVAEATPIPATVEWVDRNGVPEQLLIPPADYTSARLSPDGTQLALVVGAPLGRPTGSTSLWLYHFATNVLRQLMTDPALPDSPAWAEDGRRIFFRGRATDGAAVYAIDLATGEIERSAPVSSDFPNVFPWAPVPNQDLLAVVHAFRLDDRNIATLSLADGELSPLLNGPVHEHEPTFSPDGTWLAYQEGQTPEIVIRPFPAIGSRAGIRVGPGRTPVISRDGSELFFIDDSAIAAAPLTYGPGTVTVGTASRLFESDAYLWFLLGRAWDVDPSGQRFIVIRNAATANTTAPSAAEPARIDVVLNWFEELKNRVPTR